jgi:hypothetical protein
MLVGCKLPTVHDKYRQTSFSPFLLPQPISTLPSRTSLYAPIRLHITPAESPGLCASLGTLQAADRTMKLVPKLETTTKRYTGTETGALHRGIFCLDK